MSNYQGTGVYRHYKGSLYEVMGLSIDEETKPTGPDGYVDWDRIVTRVIYRPLSRGSMLPGPHGETFWTRRLEDFNASVRSSFVDEPRFRYIGPPDLADRGLR